MAFRGAVSLALAKYHKICVARSVADTLDQVTGTSNQHAFDRTCSVSSSKIAVAARPSDANFERAEPAACGLIQILLPKRKIN
jgi:hypothetical protein